MYGKKLRFRAVEGHLVTDIDAAFPESGMGTRRYVGRRAVIDAQPGQVGWLNTGEAQEVNFHPEYVRDCQEGALVAADEETARLCGVPWVAPEAPAKTKAEKAEKGS